MDQDRDQGPNPRQEGQPWNIPQLDWTDGATFGG